MSGKVKRLAYYSELMTQIKKKTVKRKYGVKIND